MSDRTAPTADLATGPAPAVATRTAAQTRLRWVDVARGIGIVLVVYAHVASGPLRNFIFLFHMPLFFVLSGYLHRTRPAGRAAARKARTLLVPYASFLVLIAVLTVGAKTLGDGGDLLTAADRLRRLVPALLYGGQDLTAELGAFWFVTCLFLANLLFNAILLWAGDPLSRRAVHAVAWCAVAAYLVAWLDRPTYWNAGVVPMAVVLMWAGAAWAARPARDRAVVAAAAVGVATILWAATVVPAAASFDMKSYTYGVPVVGVLLAVALTVVFVQLCRWVDLVPGVAPAIAWVGRASITVLFVHQWVHFTFEEAVPGTLALTAVATVVPLVLHQALRATPLTRVLFLGEAARRPG